MSGASHARMMSCALLLPVLSACAPLESSEAVGTASITATLVSRGSTWKYLDNGSDQGTAWRSPTFDDAAWRSGPAELGYGDGDERTIVSYGPNASSKYITTYFRRAFDVVDPSRYSGLALRVRRDDGAVVYLNGVEVWRTAMPTGTITYTTLSNAYTSETTFYETTVSPSRLVIGRNVLAVEVHQADRASSDISFDLELVATVSEVDAGTAADSGAADTGPADSGGSDAGTGASGFWAADSPWNVRLTGAESVDSNSASMIADLVAHGAITIVWKSYGVPLYDAPAGTPRGTVYYSAQGLYLRNVPLPPGMYPARGSDAHLTVRDIDPASATFGCLFDLLHCGQVGGSGSGFDYSNPRGEWVQREHNSESGWIRGASTRGSSAANMAGALTPAELQAGNIPHAIGFYVYSARADNGQPWLPSYTSDGTNSSSAAVPEGARLRLNPSFDASGLPAWQRTIVTALKTYGMYIIDQGGNDMLAVDNSHGGPWASIPYPWGTTDYPQLPVAILQNMQVLTLGARTTETYNPITTHRCGNFTTTP